jgi:hypothetical protein
VRFEFTAPYEGRMARRMARFKTTAPYEEWMARLGTCARDAERGRRRMSEFRCCPTASDARAKFKKRRGRG